ncbi:hypothetical protein [Salinarchaeum laminariae]|uniref:hypothetical protein n=1 Tax=Salinarchaeum laminariae TaxID=869888 RepID=UPI0020C06D44|nr:hypothetical protein [Salinarchaeum laminariae]
MTRTDSTNDGDELFPEQRPIYKQYAMGAAFVTATVGLAGYAVARLPEVSLGTDSPHLLALSVLAFGVGTGAFTLVLNSLYVLSFDSIRGAKVASVYATVLVLLVPLVDAGALHPRMAIVFLCLLSTGGVIHALLFKWA